MTDKSEQRSDDVRGARLPAAQRFVTLLGHADMASAILDLLSPTATYHVSGRHALSGTYSTPEEILGHLQALACRTNGTLEATKWDDWLVGGYNIAGVGQLQMQADGQLFKARHVFLFTFDSHDKIDAITVFYEDPAAAMRFFYEI